MKKLITAAMTLALAAGLASAQTPVVSDNVVGYNSVELKMGVNAIAPSFDEVLGAAMDLQDLVPGTTLGLLKGNTVGTADNIMIWDLANDKYNQYFLHSGSGKNNETKSNKWVNASTTLVAEGLVIQANASFFYVNNGTATLSLDTASPYSF